MMPINMTPGDPLIDSLVADLGAVRPRRWQREAALLFGLGLLEILLFVAIRGMRPDMHEAMGAMPFWWKSGSIAIIGGIAAVAALISLDPATTTARRLSRLWWALALAVPVLLGLGWLLDAGAAGREALLARLDWREGLACLFNVALLSLPPMMALGVLMRRGAPTQPGRTALAAGLAAAGLGAFVFAFHCSHDDPLYVAVWYGGAVAGIAGLARLVLPRLTRW
jgi:hypothetical protein